MGKQRGKRRLEDHALEGALAGADTRAGHLALQHAAASPATASVQALTGLQQSFGNRAVQRAVQPGGPVVQRVDTEDKIKELKKKKVLAKWGRIGVKALDVITMLPLHVIDQASVVDLHARDLVNYARTGKTRKERKGGGTDYGQGKALRKLGRTGLRGYMGGVRSHDLLYGNLNKKAKAAEHLHPANPFALGMWGQKKLREQEKEATAEIDRLRTGNVKGRDKAGKEIKLAIKGGGPSTDTASQDEATSAPDVVEETTADEDTPDPTMEYDEADEEASEDAA